MENLTEERRAEIFFKDGQKTIITASKEEIEKAIESYKSLSSGTRNTIKIGSSVFLVDEIRAIVLKPKTKIASF